MFGHIFVAKLFSQVRGSGFNTILGSALLLGAEAELKVGLTPFLRLTAKRPPHQGGRVCSVCGPTEGRLAFADTGDNRHG